MTVSILCSFWGYTRQAYYKDLRCLKEAYYLDHHVLSMIHLIRARQPRVGGLKLWRMLKRAGLPVGRDYIYRVLGENGLLVKTGKKRVYTTDSSGWLRQFSNLVKGLEINRPNQVWVCDITYLQAGDGFVFLSLITDAYSRKILGYHVHPNLDTDGPLTALRMAIEQAGHIAPNDIIHHSDRGCQYCSAMYVNVLKQYKIRPSTTQDGSPYDNAMAERVNGILKTEWLDNEKFDDIEQPRRKVSEVIEIYNNERLHMAINSNTPEEVYSGEKKAKTFVMF